MPRQKQLLPRTHYCCCSGEATGVRDVEVMKVASVEELCIRHHTKSHFGYNLGIQYKYNSLSCIGKRGRS